MSLLDQPKQSLDPDIWTMPRALAGAKLQPEVKAYIIKTAPIPQGSIYELVMIGSTLGYQYSASSDTDVAVISTAADVDGKMHKLFKNYNNQGHIIPNTQHPVNYFYQEFSNQYTGDWSNSMGAYSVTKDTWLKYPMSPEHIGDPSKRYEREIRYAMMLKASFESEVARFKEAYHRHDMSEAERIANDLRMFAYNLDQERKLAYNYHIGTPALQEKNITFKIMEHGPDGQLFNALLGDHA